MKQHAAEHPGDHATSLPASGDSIAPCNILAVRLGHSGNCSSVGSVVDTLFVTAAASGAIVAAICAAMATQRNRIESQPREDALCNKTHPPQPGPTDPSDGVATSIDELSHD